MNQASKHQHHQTDKKIRSDSSFSNTKNTTLISAQMTQLPLPDPMKRPFHPDDPSSRVMKETTYKRKPQKKTKSRKDGTQNSHSMEQPPQVTDSKSMSSLMQKIIAGTIAAKMKSQSKGPAESNLVT